MNSKEALKKYFGHDEFRPGQSEIIESVISGRNVLAVLPTGGGKSICYQVPALISGSFSIVISPLIALMKDQVDSLNRKEKIAAFINSTLSQRETDGVFREIESGQVKLLYLAPEKLENASFAERLKILKPSYLFVDEAHCISEWGHNFRPSYRKIKDFCDFISVVSIAAFTATATPEVVMDIILQLGMKDPKVFVKGFERDNLTIRVIKTKKKKIECFDLLSHYKTPAIVYTASRKRAEEICEFLNLYRLNAACYHAGMAPEERRHVQENFLQDKIDIIVATNAFGMGIDKKDIRLIIHYNMPGSIENYYQEIGRAGRDGLESHAFLLFDDTDRHIHNYFIENSFPDKEMILNVYNAICDYGKVALGSYCDKEISLDQKFISAYVKKDITKALLSSAIGALEQAGYLKSVSEFEKKFYLQFNIEADMLKKYVKSANDMIRDVIMILLREYGSSLINSRIQISPQKLAQIYGVSELYMDEALVFLNNIGIAVYTKPSLGNTVKLKGTRVKEQNLVLNYGKITDSYHNAVTKLDKMVEYSYSTDCRVKFIINYFGEEQKDYECGKCDNCLEHTVLSSSITDYLTEIILKTVSESEHGLSEKKLIEILSGKSEEISEKSFSTFGSCSSYTQSELKGVLEGLFSKNLLQKDGNYRRRIVPTLKGLEIIKDKTLEIFTKEEVPQDYESNLELYNKLREARNEAAKRFQQTFYLICPDDVLRRIAELKPLTQAQLLTIKGFSQKMFNKFGSDILVVIGDFLKDHTKEQQKENGKSLPGNIFETYSLIKKGYCLKDIASLRKLSEAVISMQVESILGYYPGTDIKSLYAEGEYELVSNEISKGFSDLKDLKNRLPSEIGYPLIRIAVAKFKVK